MSNTKTNNLINKTMKCFLYKLQHSYGCAINSLAKSKDSAEALSYFRKQYASIVKLIDYVNSGNALSDEALSRLNKHINSAFDSYIFSYVSSIKSSYDNTLSVEDSLTKSKPSLNVEFTLIDSEDNVSRNTVEVSSEYTEEQATNLIYQTFEICGSRVCDVVVMKGGE